MTLIYLDTTCVWWYHVMYCIGYAAWSLYGTYVLPMVSFHHIVPQAGPRGVDPVMVGVAGPRPWRTKVDAGLGGEGGGAAVAVAVVVRVVVAGPHPPRSIPPGRRRGNPCTLLHPCSGSAQEGEE